MLQYYILFANYTEGMILRDILTSNGLKSRIAPTPRSIQGELGCGMSLLINESDIDAVKACINEHHAEYHDIVSLPCQIDPRRNRFC